MRLAIATILVGCAVWSLPNASAETAKQGEIVGTLSVSGTAKVLAMGKENLQFAYEVLGTSVSAPGKGLGPTSIRCVGAFHAIKGEYKDDNGMCVNMAADGDQYFTMYQSAGKLGGVATGTWRFSGGTGKFEGIKGEGTFTRTALRPVVKGTFQSISKSVGTYQLR
jgi:hypothetical protein